MPNVYIESYGCSASQCEAEIMAGLLERAGFTIVKNERNSDLIIFVTCYVKSPTEQKILFRIGQFQKSYPRKKFIIAGCMPEGIYKSLLSIAPKASLISTHHVRDIAKAVKKTLEGKRVEYLGKSREVKLCLPKIRKNPVIDIVPISSGCNSSCSYCCVRFAKGKLFSYPKEMILKEIEGSLNQNCKEIWLTSQDNASYGLDEGDCRLPGLLDSVSKIHGSFFLRVGMMNPKNILPILKDLRKSYQSEKIYKFLHLPVQSGDSRILKKMNRGYSVKDFVRIVRDFRKDFRINLWTDVIVGFPGETKNQFENTVKLIKEVKPDWTNVSKFGLRPGVSVKSNQVPSETLSERSEKMSRIAREVSLKRNKEWIGWEGMVLISRRGREPNQWLGRNPSYKIVLVESKENLLGRFVKVEIEKADYSFLKGSLL